MKKIFSLLGCAAAIILFLQACQNNNTSDTTKLATEEALGKPAPAATDPSVAAAPATPKEPPQNADGVWHFTCPKGCAGGAGAATPCSTCGATLLHNQAYHGASQPSAAPADGATVTPKAKEEPPQNAKGVWHYTCPKGCAGGSGAASPCPQCGTVMTHNATYHQ